MNVYSTFQEKSYLGWTLADAVEVKIKPRAW
jgi:hypothetical protein